MEEARVKRTYGRRLARPLKQSATQLVDSLLPKLEIQLPAEGQLDVGGLFERKAPLHFEIGFGGGEHLAARADANPDINFIGCEPFINGTASFLGYVDSKKLQNVRIFASNALDLLATIPDGVIERIYVLFADPWPKKRHHKRRLICDEVLDMFHAKLAKNGQLFIASDHADYMGWILKHMGNRKDFLEEFNSLEKLSDWPDTRYEQKAIRDGRVPRYLIYRNN